SDGYTARSRNHPENASCGGDALPRRASASRRLSLDPDRTFAETMVPESSRAKLAAIGRRVARMTFRTKLLFISSFTVAGSVALVTGAVSVSTRRAFDRMNRERHDALLDQFRRELDARGTEITGQVQQAAASTTVQQIVAGAASYDAAQPEALAYALDFLDVVQPDLTIISSAHWPARFGYKNDWEIASGDWSATDAFLARVPLSEGTALALIAIRPASGGKALVAGGKRLTPEFLKSLGLAPGMRALMWLAPGD